MLLCSNKCLPNVHTAASAYNCQCLKGIIIKNTSCAATTPPTYAHTLKESFCCCCSLKTAQKLAGGRLLTWEVQYLQKRRAENKAL